MLFIVVERFKSSEAASEVYRRLEGTRADAARRAQILGQLGGRNLDRRFQLMETDDAKLFKQWIACWQDLVDFEVIPVVNSADAERKTGKGR